MDLQEKKITFSLSAFCIRYYCRNPATPTDSLSARATEFKLWIGIVYAIKKNNNKHTERKVKISWISKRVPIAKRTSHAIQKRVNAYLKKRAVRTPLKVMLNQHRLATFSLALAKFMRERVYNFRLRLIIIKIKITSP